MVRAWREQQLARLEADPELLAAAKQHYRYHIQDFINDWCITFDPRKIAQRMNPKMPFILFQRQDELVDFIWACIQHEADGLIEKCRDAGATWVGCGISVALWLFHEGSSIGWGSRKQDLVDRLGDPSSIFEKMRILINSLPKVFMPVGFSADSCLHYMRIVNPENGSTIVGEIGDDIGRGGRTLVYFKDESAHYTRPEKIEAALSENTRCQIDISSVNGPGTVFFRKRESGVDWQPGQEIVQHATNVFIMDWSDHPEKTPEWFKRRKAKSRAEGLEHVFAQEVERNSFAAVEGVIIQAEWFDAIVDAHLKLGIEIAGPRVGALDVADEGLDTNALSIRTDILLQYLNEWGGKDVGETTRKTVDTVTNWMIDPTSIEQWEAMEKSKRPAHPIEFVLSYDCIGIGAGVKAEAARLKRDVPSFPKHLKFSPWNAAAAVLNPFDFVVPPDPNATEQEKRESPRNREFFGNLKAQAWWLFARRCERTFRAVTESDYTWDPNDLVSISSKLPLKDKLKKELCQPTMAKNSNLKLIVNKTPEGTRSPNLGDSVVMNYCPIPPRADPALGLGGITVIGGAGAGSIQRV